MKQFLKNVLPIMACLTAAILAVEVVVPAAEAVGHWVGLADSAVFTLGAVTSLARLKNIEDQTPNPAGVRRLLVILAADLLDTVVDWPRLEDIDATGKVSVAIPVKVGKTVAIVTPADNSAEMMFENQGDRFYQSYKHGIAFDIAGNTAEQKVESKKFLNAGCIFIVEQYDGQLDVVGTKLNPIVVKQKGQTGKKGGDKRGRTFSGDNDNYIFEPPVYPSTLALPLSAVV